MPIDFIPIVCFLLLCLVIPFSMICLSIIFSVSNLDPEKLSPYECGFNPFDDARVAFDVKFYLVALLFIVFDVEIALILPFIFIFLSLEKLSLFLVFFFFILVIGFVYEWRRGALEW